MKGVAAADSSKGEPPASHHSMPLNGLDSIFGTSGEKAATVAEKWADRCLVATDRENHKSFHGV